jgi:hypothetical protein
LVLARRGRVIVKASVLQGGIVVWRLLPSLRGKAVMGGASLDFLDGVEGSGIHEVTGHCFVYFGII